MKQISYFDGYGVRLMPDAKFELLVRKAVGKVLQTHGFRVSKPGAKARKAASEAIAAYCTRGGKPIKQASAEGGVPAYFIEKYSQ